MTRRIAKNIIAGAAIIAAIIVMHAIPELFADWISGL